MKRVSYSEKEEYFMNENGLRYRRNLHMSLSRLGFLHEMILSETRHERSQIKDNASDYDSSMHTMPNNLYFQ